MHHGFQKIWSMLIIINVSWAANHHNRMISEGSCDAEDWSNDAENSSAHHRNEWHFTIYSNRKEFNLNCNIISQYSHKKMNPKLLHYILSLKTMTLVQRLNLTICIILITLASTKRDGGSIANPLGQFWWIYLSSFTTNHIWFGLFSIHL